MALAFSADAALLASASYDRSVRVWDVGQRRVLHVLSGHTDRVTCVAILARGGEPACADAGEAAEGQDRRERHMLLASGSYDKQIRVWDMQTAKPYQPEGAGAPADR